MTKKELIEQLKDVPDDEPIGVADSLGDVVHLLGVQLRNLDELIDEYRVVLLVDY